MNERMDAEGQNGAKRHVETDKPIWAEWCTVAQASAALILFYYFFLYDLSIKLICVSFFCIQTKENKAKCQSHLKKKKS